MVRELPLLLGAIGTVLGFFTLPVLLMLLSGYQGSVASLFADPFVLGWAVSPFLGLAGAFNVKKHGKTGGLLLVVAGTLPWIASVLSSNVSFVAFFWTPMLVVAGILAILNWPGPYIEKEEVGGDSQ
jgi:hypothetical protein